MKKELGFKLLLEVVQGKELDGIPHFNHGGNNGMFVANSFNIKDLKGMVYSAYYFSPKRSKQHGLRYTLTLQFVEKIDGAYVFNIVMNRFDEDFQVGYMTVNGHAIAYGFTEEIQIGIKPVKTISGSNR